MAAGPVLVLVLLLLPAGGGAVPGGPESDAPSEPPPPDVTTPWDTAYQEQCAAPPVTGPCRASFQRWYHSPKHRDCRPFTYGGCRGNSNNYHLRDDCLRRCRSGGDNSSWHTTALLAALLLVSLLLVAVVVVTVTRRGVTRRGVSVTHCCDTRSTADKETLMGSADA